MAFAVAKDTYGRICKAKEAQGKILSFLMKTMRIDFVIPHENHED
jgi:hypothetical protein